MRIVALLTLRNEALYLQTCLENLISQGLEVIVIDNGSTDQSVAIATAFLGAGVISVEHYPYPGYYDWKGILDHKMALAGEIEADWLMHCDADEIRQAPAPFLSLKQGVEEADRTGFNAINFDEFVFLPTSVEERYEGADYPELMRSYYYFSPSPLRRVNLWKKTANPVDIASSGGHSADFEGRRVFPESFVLRHYIALSHQHAVDKYTKARVYSKMEIESLGWHRARANLQDWEIVLPIPDQMQTLVDQEFDRSKPMRKHLLFSR